jgi:hypothetical protein
MNQPFHFPDGRLANNADDLLELCQQYPDRATEFLVRHDLENWLAYIGNYDLAECATNARQSDLEDRQKLEEFLNISHSLTMPKPVPAAIPESQAGQNVASAESALIQTPEKQTPQESDNDLSAASDRAIETVDETEDLAAVESALSENEEESIDSSSTPSPEPSVDESEDLATAESALIGNSVASDTAPTTSKTTAESSDNEKPSFFQVVAKFIVKILYRNKA